METTLAEVVREGEYLPAFQGPPRPEEERDHAYNIWAVEAGRDLTKTAELTNIPYKTLWRWHRTDHWQERWTKEWGEITAPAVRSASAIVAMRVDEIVNALTIAATDPDHPQFVQAAKLALDLVRDPQDVAEVGASGVRVQILNQFNTMTEDQMKKAVAAHLSDNMELHQRERSRKAQSG